MAGQPKTRLKRQLAALESVAEEHPELKAAILDSTAKAQGDNTARARAREALRGALSAGPVTRAAVDAATGDEIGRLTAALQPGILARITRLRPVYANGWIEDYPLDSSDVGELLEYLASEHGGQTYRVTLLSPDGQPYLHCKVPIAGPPRKNGRLAPREAWTGEEERRPTTQAQAPQPAAPSFEPLTKILEMMLENERRSADQRVESERHASEKLLGSVRELISTASKGNEELLKGVIAARRDESESQSLGAQVKRLRADIGAVSELSQAITADDRSAIVPKDKPDLDGMFQTAASDFLSKAMQAKFMKPPTNGQTAGSTADIPNAKLD